MVYMYICMYCVIIYNIRVYIVYIIYIYIYIMTRCGAPQRCPQGCALRVRRLS